MSSFIQLQLYTPPTLMINKDFLRQVMSGEKELMPRQQVKSVDVPHFDELSVKNIWPIVKDDAKFMSYFPDVLPKNRLPEREYFFNILNTTHGEYMQKLIHHAC